MAFSTDIGIDLGTTTTKMYIEGKGIVLNQPTIIAVDRLTEEVLAVGRKANIMMGRTAENVSAVKPLTGGRVSNFSAVQVMLKYYLKSIERSRFFKPNIAVCIPCGATDVERRAVEEALWQAGARTVSLIPSPIASMLGSGYAVLGKTGLMMGDIGGGKSEFAIISCGGIVSQTTLKLGGEDINKQIIEHIRKEHSLIIGMHTAENVKLEIGTLGKTNEHMKMEVRGRGTLSGLPEVTTVTAEEIKGKISDIIREIADAALITVEKAPPELAADVRNYGILLSGGTALMPGIDKFLKKELSIDVKIVEKPLDCAVEGTGKSLSGRKKGLFIAKE